MLAQVMTGSLRLLYMLLKLLIMRFLYGKQMLLCSSQFKDDKLLKLGDTAEISYIMKDATHTGNDLRMIGIMTGEG